MLAVSPHIVVKADQGDGNLSDVVARLERLELLLIDLQARRQADSLAVDELAPPMPS